MVWDLPYVERIRQRQRIDGNTVGSLLRVHGMRPMLCKMPSSIDMNILVPQKLLAPHRRDGTDGVFSVYDAEYKFLLVLWRHNLKVVRKRLLADTRSSKDIQVTDEVPQKLFFSVELPTYEFREKESRVGCAQRMALLERR